VPRRVVPHIGRPTDAQVPGGREAGPTGNGAVPAANRTGRVELVGLDDLAADWTSLAAAGGNPFGSYEWASCWWRHHGGERRPLVVAGWGADGRLVAVLPLYLWATRPLRILRFLGHGGGDQRGPVHAPGDGEVAAALARQALAKIGWDVFVGEQLPANALRRDLLGGRGICPAG